jgi:hypothetical protein
MFIECFGEVRVPYKDREYLFEERSLFGYVYKVDEDLGKAAIATGKCSEVKDYKGPVETPSSSPSMAWMNLRPAAAVSDTPAPAAEPAASPVAPRVPGRPRTRG